MQTQDVDLYEDCYRVRNTVKEKCQFNKNFVRTPSNTASRVCSSACSRDSPFDPRERTMHMITEIRFASRLALRNGESFVLSSASSGRFAQFPTQIARSVPLTARVPSTRGRRASEPREDVASFDQPLGCVSLRHRTRGFGRDRQSQHFPRLYANISTSCLHCAVLMTLQHRTRPGIA